MSSQDMVTAAQATCSDPVADGVSIYNHVLSIPHAQFSHFVTQVTHLCPNASSSTNSSLFVWCGSIPSTLARKALEDPAVSRRHSDSEKKEEQEEEDAELAAALAASGRSENARDSVVIPPGLLTQEFAVAMASRTTAAGTGLFSTPSDIALPMARRIATKLGIAQLFLSLDLPHPLMPTPGQPQKSEDSSALLALERALKQVCSTVLNKADQ